MFTPLFEGLRAEGVPVSLREYLTLLQAMHGGLADDDIETFYYLARAALVKDETKIDAFDRVFARVFQGLQSLSEAGDTVDVAQLPEEWLRALADRVFTEEEKAQIEALGGFEKLMETLRERLQEQQGRHQGGNKWIGTGGTSPFGHGGYNPEGVRIGGPGRHRRAVKVWDKREFRDLDGNVEIGTRAIRIALRKLRKLARTGATEELDLPETIEATAREGFLDVRTRRERQNAIKVLLLLDIGGSMDDHVKVCEELFSAAKSEFHSLTQFYFHNCVYEGLWTSNARRRTEVTPTIDVVRRFPPDTRLIFVGDAAMSPYEIVAPGGSVEHWNAEAGAVWMNRLLGHFTKAAWINPVRGDLWQYTQSTGIMSDLMEGRMFELTLSGLDAAIDALRR
ncbi:VWA domain-containing protein [Acuticoccus sp. I52.16.1]|uniref:vWA domain-containing protein n=1 Tax=Acuticoccus sp. I52.16.1 TaxID=2928472 RepID=UPI001FD56277|nr:VWA domain-containing protein [Acuticoccus sp. I52.16.1]UOM33157.1 VWA domain-containing protein [Acuticoccus sp. I52.16.1]